MPKTKRNVGRRFPVIIRFVLLLGVLLALLLGLLEMGVRMIFPEINHQGTELALFRDHAYGDAMGWRPNAVGGAFGAPVVIDEMGFRKLASPVDYRESWLILGDSVTFGVGVDAADTFVGRLQNHFTDVKLWNSAVVGYSAKDYQAVLEHFKDPQKRMRRVVLFLCLNDVYPSPNIIPVPAGAFKKSLAWLGRNSKTYLLLKNIFSDRSRRYFETDLVFYDERRPEYKELLQTLGAISKKAGADEMPLTVVILPYEYQLRVKNDTALRPQKMLREFCTTNHITCLDAYSWFAESGIDSKKLYLYADAMHLSSEGHRIIAAHLVDELKSP